MLTTEQPENYVMNYQCAGFDVDLMTGNSMKYRIDKPIAELLEMLVKVLVQLTRQLMDQEVSILDNDVRTKQTQYSQAQTSYLNLQKRQTYPRI